MLTDADMEQARFLIRVGQTWTDYFRRRHGPDLAGPCPDSDESVPPDSTGAHDEEVPGPERRDYGFRFLPKTFPLKVPGKEISEIGMDSDAHVPSSSSVGAKPPYYF